VDSTGSGRRRLLTTIQLAAVVFAGLACATDLRDGRIPNVLTFGSLVLALIVHGLLPQGHGWGHALLGLLAGGAIFFPFFALGGMGAGDVKLMAALGAWLGWQPALFVAMYGAVAGGVLAIVVALASGYLRQALTNLGQLLMHWRVAGIKPVPDLTLEHARGPRLAYAVPIFIGLLVTLWRS
jgi:prepilin peptidase CpaA